MVFLALAALLAGIACGLLGGDLPAVDALLSAGRAYLREQGLLRSDEGAGNMVNKRFLQ